jgi:ABC-type glutathione transport system ATPase component
VLAAYPHQLSGGEIQRIVIAQALLGQPELLIADEPTTALDAITSREIIELLVRLRKELGMALMFITHRRELLPLVTDRCLEIRDRAVVGAVPVLPAQETGTISKPEDQGSSHILLQTKDLSIRYEGDRYGVRECNLVLYRGRCTALVGPSGCGKSTLAAFLVGLLPGDSGVLRVGSREEVVPRDTADLLAELNAQLIFQDVGGSLNPRHTVGRAIREVSRNGATVDDVLNRVELPPEIYADRYPGQLSGGEQQRVAIARALATRPRLLICDEAFAALDRPLRQRLQLLLRKLGREDGLSILLITHDLRQVATFTDVILIMERGRIVERGTPGDVLLRPKTALGRQLAAAAGFGGGEAE